ncbi:hypothetical protein [Pelotalea chapellei]|uniref:Uncharacterized protein n=1 Tax=Pelotalea chapellei TaxID=44671 RepID=A0ABS5U9D6_9BACT|nr:hypothetical protein [Pelotalea chapellei]MBT1072302.1 hypothetical protein [Pelotalea chapellei]
MPLDNCKRSQCYEIFSQSTGLEISGMSKTLKEHDQAVGRIGRIQLRFFKLMPKSKPEEVTQIRFICEPDEAYNLAIMIAQIAGSSVPCKEKLNPHKFQAGEQGETVTTLAVEKWERSGKNGFALTVSRGKDFISVPVPQIKFQFLAEFLRHLAVEQCWIERLERRASI